MIALTLLTAMAALTEQQALTALTVMVVLTALIAVPYNNISHFKGHTKGVFTLSMT
jgi:hypothetical protein